jgi:cell division transport system permease protein
MANGLRRNLTMTIAVIVTVAISLSLAGAGLLIGRQVATMKGYWYDKVEVSVFLNNDVTPADRDAINAKLHDLRLVERVYYESKADAYNRFKDQFKDSPDLVKNVTADALPESFRVKLTDPTRFDVVATAMSGQPGVEEVQDQRKLLDKFFRVLNGFQTAALIVALVQVGAAALLISNTIRVAAFSRRRETGIMRLVGASNLYIQLPFLLEGALAGLVGGVLAAGSVAALKAFFIDRQLKDKGGITAIPFVGWDAVFQTWAYVVPLGILLSAFVSFVTLRRHLRV